MRTHPSSFRINTLLGLSLLVAGLVTGVGGCAKKPQQAVDDSSTVPTAPSTQDADANPMGQSDDGQAMGLQTVRFPYDSASLDSEGIATLKGNAQILKDMSSLKIQVEGHCDQRGGIQYNIALGEKRANGVKKYLEDLGIAADRLSTISYGKEKPLDPAENEAAYSKNRRANFVITAR